MILEIFLFRSQSHHESGRDFSMTFCGLRIDNLDTIDDLRNVVASWASRLKHVPGTRGKYLYVLSEGWNAWTIGQMLKAETDARKRKARLSLNDRIDQMNHIMWIESKKYH